MQLGMVGLGKMGGNMVRRLMSGGHECVVFDLSLDNVKVFEREGGVGTSSLDDFVRALRKPRVAWMMVPAGTATEQTFLQLADRMEPGDIIVDDCHAYYNDDVRRAGFLKHKGIRYADVGTSGGIWGVTRGYCIMAGCDSEVFRYLEPLFKTLAPGRGDVTATPGREHLVGTA